MRHWEGWLRVCESNACVEVRLGEDGLVELRSSLSPYAVARMTKSEFTRFIASVRAGDYDAFGEDHGPTVITWKEASTLAKEQLLDIEARRDQQLLQEGYTGDL